MKGFKETNRNIYATYSLTRLRYKSSISSSRKSAKRDIIEAFKKDFRKVEEDLRCFVRRLRRNFESH